MAYASDEVTTSRWMRTGSPSGDGPDQHTPARPPRDIKKNFLVFGLGLLSWVATYVGMLELIEANMGDLPFAHKIIIGFSVAMLMTMIIWLLDRLFSPIGPLTRAAYIFGYLFLTLISVGFSFGFYWKVLESRSEASRSAESAVGQVQGSLHAASTRLEQLNATLVQLSAVSLEKAELERAKGTSCPNSKPGDGPRRKMREDDASRFSFASDFVKGRVASVNGEMSALNGDLAKIAAKDASLIDPKSGTRNEFMKALGRKLDMTVTGFNAFRTDPQLKQMRTDLSDRAEKVTFGDPKSGGFVCPDAQLQQALRGAVRAIDQLPVLEKPEIAAVEGSEATIEAFRRLTTTLYGLMSFKMPPSADELRELQQKAVQSVEGGAAAQRALSPDAAGLSKRDYVPLGIAIFVDLCLFLVSIGRPANRLHGLMPKMREAETGPVSEILSRFNDIHRDPEVRESFELFRHVVFDMNGDYYVAVPLDAPLRMNPQQREQLRVEAQLLSNLFASFEKEKIFTRTWMPLTGRVKSKLRRQGSKFAESDAFRVYRFRKGAWSEIILGAVMGAAKRAEENKRQTALEQVQTASVSRVPPVSLARDGGRDDRHRSQRPQPVERAQPIVRSETRNDRRSEPNWRSEPDWPNRMQTVPTAEASQRPSELRPSEQRPDVSAAYGRYAQYNPPHPRTQQTLDTAPAAPAVFTPANGNTAPSFAHARSAASDHSIAAAGPEALVAFGGGEPHAALRRPSSQVLSQPGHHIAMNHTPQAAPEPQAARSDDTIVVLRRETATVSLPANDGGQASDIISRLGQALAGAVIVEAAEVLPALVIAPAQITYLNDDTAEIEPDEDASPAPDLNDDPLTSDAAIMAGRLRPIRIGEK